MFSAFFFGWPGVNADSMVSFSVLNFWFGGLGFPSTYFFFENGSVWRSVSLMVWWTRANVALSWAPYNRSQTFLRSTISSSYIHRPRRADQLATWWVPGPRDCPATLLPNVCGPLLALSSFYCLGWRKSMNFTKDPWSATFYTGKNGER